MNQYNAGMAKRVRISLANKCQLLFGFAVILILTAALSVMWLRMHRLVESLPMKRADDFAAAWLADQIQLGGSLTPIDQAVGPLPADVDLQLSLFDETDFDRVRERDSFLDRAIDQFETPGGPMRLFERARDESGNIYYRYARAIRKSDLSRLRGGLLVGFGPRLDTTGLADPLERVLVIHLRDEDARKEERLNRLYFVLAGLLAGLLAIAVFWFITTRLILSPVRLLRSYAQKVSEGDLNIRSDINTGDEFEQLSDMFNTMLENLKKNQDQLRSINKSLDLKLGELAESNVALYEANKIKGEFLANVSHELRTPLNSIIGFAEVLQETLSDRTGPVDEKRKRYAQNIITSSKRLLDLINDLLDLAKIEAGKIDLRVTTVSLADTCEGLLNLIRPQTEKRGVALKQKMAPNLPMVETDASKLQQIIFNFLSNAVKFTPEGGTVTLSAALEPRKGDHEPAAIRISVMDTGPGIDPDDHERIFDKFTQLDPSVTREYGGTGLGLTISRELAQMLQGRIEVDSQPGEGATFSIIIPIVLRDQKTPLMPT